MLDLNPETKNMCNAPVPCQTLLFHQNRYSIKEDPNETNLILLTGSSESRYSIKEDPVTDTRNSNTYSDLPLFLTLIFAFCWCLEGFLIDKSAKK